MLYPIQAYLRGSGLASLITAVLRILTKAAFTDSPDSLRLSACVFYVTSALICWMCMFIHRKIIVPHPVWQEATRTDERQPLLQESRLDDGVSRSLWSRMVESPWMKTGNKIKLASLCMFLTMFSQLAIFPGILTDIEVRPSCIEKCAYLFSCLCSVPPWAATMKSCWCCSMPCRVSSLDGCLERGLRRRRDTFRF